MSEGRTWNSEDTPSARFKGYRFKGSTTRPHLELLNTSTLELRKTGFAAMEGLFLALCGNDNCGIRVEQITVEPIQELKIDKVRGFLV